MIDDNNSELFDGATEISHTERGETFGMSKGTYFRMAQTANTAASMGIEPSTIAILPDGLPGCRLVLYGKMHAFQVFVRVREKRAFVDCLAERLDEKLHAWVPLISVLPDCDQTWSRALRAMAAAENIAYYDSHWAAEQGDIGEA